MAWTLAEGAVDAIKTYLNDTIPGKLDVIDAEIGDGITLADPTSWVVGEHDLERVAETPLGFVLVDDMIIEGWGDTSIDATTTLLIGIIVDDDDSDNLRKRIYRYGRAIIETIIDGKDTAGLSSFQPVGEISVDYSPTLTDGSRFIGSVAIEWRFQKIETRS